MWGFPGWGLQVRTPLSRRGAASTSARSHGTPALTKPHPPATRPFSRPRSLLTSGRGASLLRVSTAHVSLGARSYRAGRLVNRDRPLSCAGASPAWLPRPLASSARLQLAPDSFPQTRHAALLPLRGKAPPRLRPAAPRPRTWDLYPDWPPREPARPGIGPAARRRGGGTQAAAIPVTRLPTSRIPVPALASPLLDKSEGFPHLPSAGGRSGMFHFSVEKRGRELKPGCYPRLPPFHLAVAPLASSRVFPGGNQSREEPPASLGDGRGVGTPKGK